ncbi:MAG: hypothetical protein COC12_11100 [Rhodobacteraceae bacterium]|nr:MAG: hypothetical protein COC12_11100 [Paracoccaceae bacterium]
MPSGSGPDDQKGRAGKSPGRLDDTVRATAYLAKSPDFVSTTGPVRLPLTTFRPQAKNTGR